MQETIFEELFLKYVFALWPCPLYSYIACIRISLVPVHKNIFWELISVQIHAAHVFTPGRMQENTPGELFMYWFRARGYDGSPMIGMLLMGNRVGGGGSVGGSFFTYSWSFVSYS